MILPHGSEGDYVPTPLFTVGEGAKNLGVGRKVLYQLIERGEIRAVRAKGTTYVEKASLDVFRAKGMLA
jgi:excisionase family DNA binding protein